MLYNYVYTRLIEKSSLARNNSIHSVGAGIYSDSLLVVAFSDARFAVTISLARQMLSE
jgi:hypothetical protein